jgi:release factor glutamine methyltransferase
MTAAAEVASRLSIAAARRDLAGRFREAGLDVPELEARLLVGYALALDHAGLARESARVLTPGEVEAVSALALRRLAREPIARILGRKEFWGLPFALNADTLVPRPETETVVEAVLAALARDCRRADTLRIADLGTGAGVLLLALLSEMPGASGIGTDISPAALACARANATDIGLPGRASFVVCDYGTALAGPIDILISNPPYVARREIAGLQAEVRDYDPLRALDGGRDGLDGYRAVAADARRLLAADGLLALELGPGQAAAVIAIFAEASLAPAALNYDLQGVDRALILRPVP